MLDQLKNTNPFSVPEGYFEQFAATLETKIRQTENEKRTAHRVAFFREARPYLMVAAMLVVIFVVLQRVVIPFGSRSAQNNEIAGANVVVTENDALYSHIMTDEYTFLEYVGNEN